MRNRRRTSASGRCRFVIAAPFVLLAALAAPSSGQDFRIVEISAEPSSEKVSPAGSSERVLRAADGAALVPLGQGFVTEIEPNGTSAQATPLGGADVTAWGVIFPNGDNDVWSFAASAGDRVYAATMTSFSASSGDTVLEILDVDGTTILETDNDDGSLAGTSSSIAGRTLPASGTYFVRVRGNTATTQVRPYHLHVRVQSGAPVAETEPNNLPSPQPLPAGGWVSGAIDPASDTDTFSLALSAGDTVYISLDADPERDATTWNPRIGLATFGTPPSILVVNDANVTSPNSEAFFLTVKDTGTYTVYVDHPTGVGGATQTYHLSVSVHPSTNQGATCTTYSSTDVPQVIPDGPGQVSSTITIPGNPRIADLDVAIELNHLNMPDLDVHLVSPAGNDNGLFTDIGAAAQPGMNLVLDDEGGFPLGLFTIVAGIAFQPELAYRLSWFDNEDAGGTWTLVIRDDTAANGGNLLNWSLRVCEPPPPPACGPGFAPVTVYQSDFETDDGGFTHSGTQDEWERGLPTFVPITTCASGTNCWKTDLDNSYNASSIQDLVSPALDLAGLSPPVVVSWSQRYQMESATFDHFNVSAREVGNPSNSVALFEWLDATMTNAVGNPTTTIQESAGWARFIRRADTLAGLQAELLFHVDTDTTVQLAGVAIDDVTVTACEPANPEISLSKTVGLVAGTCGVDETLTVEHGTPVTYCYTVTNTGGVPLTSHTLVDDQLGTILENFQYVLNPGASAFITVDDVLLDATTTNVATWTASDSEVTTACSAGGITITGASGTPYPSTAALAGATSAPDRVEVHLENVSHAFTEDIDALLVGPGGQTLVVMSDAGGGESILDVDLDLDDLAPAPLAEDDPLESGAFRPADYTDQADAWPAPAPPGPYGRAEPTGSDTFTSVFGGLDPNGTWNLYVTDAFPALDDGSIGNWCISAIEDLFEASDSDSVTVTVLIPDIAVDPASLSSFQAVDTQVVETLDITNNGDATLDWSIAEDDGLGGRMRTVRVPGRQEPIRAHRTMPAPAAEPRTAAEKSFGRAESADAGRVVRPEPRLVPEGTVTITHSASQTITVGNSVSCNSGGLHTDNSYIRRFDLGAFGITGAFEVVEVSFGVEQAIGAGGDQPVTVNLYTWDPLDPFTFANFSLIGTATGNIPDQAGTIATFPVAGTAPAGSTLVVELFTPNGQVDGNSLFVGSNPDGQTDPTFLAAATCGVVEPTDTAVIGFPGMHWVLNVTGQAGCDVDLPWVSVNPATGATAPLDTDTVDVTFDSTGLDLGGIYTGALCVESDDPDAPTVLVPLTLEVDSMPFIDGFESGDTSEWTATQP